MSDSKDVKICKRSCACVPIIDETSGLNVGQLRICNTESEKFVRLQYVLNSPTARFTSIEFDIQSRCFEIPFGAFGCPDPTAFSYRFTFVTPTTVYAQLPAEFSFVVPLPLFNLKAMCAVSRIGYVADSTGSLAAPLFAWAGDEQACSPIAVDPPFIRRFRFCVQDCTICCEDDAEHKSALNCDFCADSGKARCKCRPAQCCPTATTVVAPLPPTTLPGTLFALSLIHI